VTINIEDVLYIDIYIDIYIGNFLSTLKNPFLGIV